MINNALSKPLNSNVKIVISIGDDLGVGPEIILKAMSSKQLSNKNEFLIVGSKKTLTSTYVLLRSLGVKNIADPDELNIKDIEIPKISENQNSINSGNTSFYYLKTAIEIVKALPNAVLVTGPICKKSWALANHFYSGQTELLAESCNSTNVGMLFTAKSPYTDWRFNTLLATTHIPLTEVSQNLTDNLICSKLDLLYDFSKRFNEKPNIKIAGLNPHAGENGILGLEEKELIKESLSKWNQRNSEVCLEGPISPDSCWISSSKAWKEKDAKGHDGILAMYHDQGLIPMKIIAQNYSVNTTLGLPFIRTSPDHGTGFDIANKGIAQSQSMIEAIKTAIELCKNS